MKTPLFLEKAPLAPSNTFLQTQFWANLKHQFGWQYEGYRAQYKQQEVSFLLLYRVIFKKIALAYIPLANFSAISPAELPLFLKLLSKKLKKQLPFLTIFIRFDLATEKTVLNAKKIPLSKAPMDIQPPDTTILALLPSEEELLAKMHKKTRYNIGLAKKKGVSIRKATLSELPLWYQLYEETAKRDKIAIHSLNYYETFFKLAETEATTTPLLYLAEHENELLGGIIVLYYHDTATYVYGASSNTKRNLMGNYALQWQAICDAKQKNLSFYDFFGIPPTANKNHPLHGLYQFKVGFGGHMVHRHGAYDAVCQPVLYLGYAFLERLRKLNKVLRKR